MKVLSYFFPLVILLTITACSSDNEILPDEVTVTFSYDQFVLQEDVDNFRTQAPDWEHVFGGTGHIVFTEVNGKYEVDFNFDGTQLETLSVIVPPGSYNIDMWFEAGLYEIFFPFTASATNQEIIENATVELTVSTNYALILVNGNPPVGDTAPAWDADKSGGIGGDNEGFLTQMTGIYHYAYIPEGVDGNLHIYYNNDDLKIITNIVAEAAKVYKYKVVTGGTTNLDLDLYTLFEEYYFEIGG